MPQKQENADYLATVRGCLHMWLSSPSLTAGAALRHFKFEAALPSLSPETANPAPTIGIFLA